MYQNKIVLCGASSYTKKYYLNQDFGSLPKEIKEDLQILCVLFTEEIGGIFEMSFTEDGELMLETSAGDEDLLYDEIGGALKIKQLRRERKELFESLETYFRVFFMEDKEEMDDIESILG